MRFDDEDEDELGKITSEAAAAAAVAMMTMKVMVIRISLERVILLVRFYLMSRNECFDRGNRCLTLRH